MQLQLVARGTELNFEICLAWLVHHGVSGHTRHGRFHLSVSAGVIGQHAHLRQLAGTDKADICRLDADVHQQRRFIRHHLQNGLAGRGYRAQRGNQDTVDNAVCRRQQLAPRYPVFPTTHGAG